MVVDGLLRGLRVYTQATKPQSDCQAGQHAAANNQRVITHDAFRSVKDELQ